jgi:hypothetical protein
LKERTSERKEDLAKLRRNKPGIMKREVEGGGLKTEGKQRISSPSCSYFSLQSNNLIRR